VKTPLSKKTDAKKRFAAVSNYNNNKNNANDNNMNDNKNDDDNDAFSLIEFIEDNARVVFAIAFTSLLFGMIISAMMSNKQQPGPPVKAGDTAVSKKATDDDGKQNDKGSDKND